MNQLQVQAIAETNDQEIFQANRENNVTEKQLVKWVEFVWRDKSNQSRLRRMPKYMHAKIAATDVVE